jgi:hypothetical protein
MVTTYGRTLFLAGCFTLALVAAGLRPQPLQSGPLEERAAQLAGLIVATAIAAEGGTRISTMPPGQNAPRIR